MDPRERRICCGGIGLPAYLKDPLAGVLKDVAGTSALLSSCLINFSRSSRPGSPEHSDRVSTAVSGDIAPRVDNPFRAIRANNAIGKARDFLVYEQTLNRIPDNIFCRQDEHTQKRRVEIGAGLFRGNPNMRYSSSEPSALITLQIPVQLPTLARPLSLSQLILARLSCSSIAYAQ